MMLDFLYSIYLKYVAFGQF